MELIEKYHLLKQVAIDLMATGDLKSYVKIMIQLEDVKQQIIPKYLNN